MQRPPWLVRLVAVAVAGALAASCGSDDGSPSGITGADGTGPPSALSGDLTVFAAASLAAAFDELGAAFTVAHPEVEVTLNFAGSSELAAQIDNGAPADVFAAADEETMTRLVDADGTAGAPVVFAHNVAEIIVARGNPLGITGVADLADDDLVVVTCAPEVPCGNYAAQIFSRAGVAVTPKSLERNVSAVVTKVLFDEADAGVVYRTDVIAAGDSADGVPIPLDDNVVEYPIAAIAEAPNPGAAAAFVDFVVSERGQRILTAHGFTSP